jgi:nucleoside-diphosphate-sugar epimerase
MKKAIVTGASGLIGRHVIRELLANDVKVLAIGRNGEINSDFFIKDSLDNLSYLQLDLKQIDMLPKKLNEVGWVVDKSCVFYHFAWSGFTTLTDGTVDDQLKNVTYSANAVKIAKELNCAKFINSGTLEETFAEKYLKNSWNNNHYHSNQGSYAISKLSSRDMCLMVAYLEKIDYIHTRFSAVYNNELNLKGFICSSLRLILEGKKASIPQNKQLFDLISIEDLSKAFYYIGLKGKNKSNYFIGTGKPKTLISLFTELENSLQGIKSKPESDELNLILKHKDFDVSDLKNDTGFEINNTFLNLKV